jgi:hypothetical protein
MKITDLFDKEDVQKIKHVCFVYNAKIIIIDGVEYNAPKEVK